MVNEARSDRHLYSAFAPTQAASDAAVPVTAYPQLALAGLVSFFGSLSAADGMVPRRRVRTLSVDSSISDLVALARSTGHSRFPVVGADLDDVRGVVHVKDVYRVPSDERSQRSIESITRTSSVARWGFSFNPNCSCRAVNSAGSSPGLR